MASLLAACASTWMCRVDIYETLRPFQELLQEYSATNTTIANAGRGISAYIAQVLRQHPCYVHYAGWAIPCRGCIPVQVAREAHCPQSAGLHNAAQIQQLVTR